MTHEWHYAQNGKQLGPIAAAELRGLAASGQLQSTDLVWKEGMPEWVPASRIKGLIPSGAAESPSRPPPVADPLPTPARPSATLLGGYDTAQASVAARQFGHQAKDVAIAAGTDAAKAVKALVLNPVGGLKIAFENLGPQRAMIVGVVFAIAFDLCILFGMWLLISHFLAPSGYQPEMQTDYTDSADPSMGIGMIFKLIVLGLVPLISATAGCAAVRKFFRGQGSIQSDIFIAGASLLPFGVAVLLTGILGLGNIEIIAILGVFALTTTILMMYSGCTTLQGIPDAAATLSVPLMILADVYVCKIILTSILA